MKTIRRHDKQNQQQILQAKREAQQTILELHGLLSRPDRKGLTVGEMVNVAATMGLLNSENKHAG